MNPLQTPRRFAAVCRLKNRGRDGGWNPLALGRRLDQGAKHERPKKRPPGEGRPCAVSGMGLVNPALAVQDKKHRKNDNSTDHNIVIRTHFLPPWEGNDRPCDQAPSMIRTPPDTHPACQSLRKNAVAISATPSMAKMFAQYFSMRPPVQR